MAKSNETKQTGSIACPFCGAAATGSYSTIVEANGAGPTKVLYKCNSCGRFYTAERVISWRITES